MTEPDQPTGPSRARDPDSEEGNHPTTPLAGVSGPSSGNGLQPGAVIARRFTLTRLIGRGGMGVVWQARDMSLGREVAIKFLGNEVAVDPEAVADLRRETRRSLELTHPNIVRIYDYVEDPELRLVGISMELLSGMSVQLMKLEQPQRAFTPEKVLPWLKQICAAIDYAHQVVGVIHRDIKPGNLFVNERGSVKIVDFGIAMVVRDSTSRLVQEARLSRSGTLAYMSHQQLKGDKPTPADDIYAIGALVYELFTSKPPFFRGDAHALMHQIMSQSPMRIAERQQELDVKGIPVPPNWENAILACLSKDASARPASGQALLAMIGAPVASDLGDATVLASNLPRMGIDLEKTMVMGRVPAMAAALVPPNVPTPPLLPPTNGIPPVAAVPPAPEKKKKTSWLSWLGEAGVKPAIATVMTLLVSALVAWLMGGFGGPPGLVVDVQPRDADAQVSVDGRSSISLPAKGPLRIRDLSDGDHSVAVEAKGFKRVREEVTVTKGKGQIEVKLMPVYGALELIARPGSHYTLTPRAPDKPVKGDVGASGKVLLEKLRPGDFQIHVEHPDCLALDLGEVPIGPDEITYRRAVQKTIPASVFVTSQPSGAAIFIEGRARGTTPKEITDLPAETNLSIEARFEGHEAARTNFNLKPGQRQDVSFDLKQIRGSLVVSARPGTEVVARRAGQPNIRLGTIGPSGEETFEGILPQGKYSIVLEHPDLRPDTPTDVEIDPRKTTRLTGKQEVWGSSLDVRSEPSGATVVINGATRGTTPTVIDGLPSGAPLAVEFRLRGKTPISRAVTLRPRETGTLFVDGFTAVRFSVKVDVQPWDALRSRKLNFTVDGNQVAPRSVSDSIFDVSMENSGLHNIEVEADGFRPRSIRVDAGTAEGRAYRITLEPIPVPVRVAAPSTPEARNGQSGGPGNRGEPDNRASYISDIVPKDADSVGSVKLPGGKSAATVIAALKTVSEARGWTVSKIDGDVVMLTLKKRGYDATVYCRVTASGVDFISDSYKSGRLPLMGGKNERTVPSGWIDNLKEDLVDRLGKK